MPISRDEINALFFAVIVGVFGAMLLDFILPDELPTRSRGWIELLVGLGVTFIVFRVRTQAAVEMQPVPAYVVDTSSLIDGRLADIVSLKLLEGKLFVPPLVVAELQGLADSGEKHRRARGRRGLDVLDRLRNAPQVRLVLDLPAGVGGGEGPVDRRLVTLSQQLQARLVTQDFNLNKVATAHGIEVVNLNDVAKALRPVCLPGDQLTVSLVKRGEQSGQAVGYLDDGTMVVVDGGREHVGKSAAVAVTSITQTSAGRMIFGRFEQTIDEPAPTA